VRYLARPDRVRLATEQRQQLSFASL
jgi:hypothetical protein